MGFKGLLAACLCATQLSFAFGAETARLRVFSLNLHGYHPMGEARRGLESRDGRLEAADSHLFYFTREELDRGSVRALETLSRDIPLIDPDLILLQEVGAGAPGRPKSCLEFLRTGNSVDAFGLNTAERLRRRLRSDYQLSLACRGNTGWWTETGSFADRRVVRLDQQGKSTGVVFDFGSSPYPDGILIEGMAVLVKAPWRILEGQDWRVSVTDETHFAQLVVISDGTRWVAVLNVHLGHKLRNFEQAAALRERLHLFLSEARFPGRFAGVIVGGDFNAEVYRPTRGMNEVSLVPWEIAFPGEYDFSREVKNPRGGALADLLWAMNADEQHKPWANIRNPEEARRRINSSLRRLSLLGVGLEPLSEALWKSPVCRYDERVEGACSIPGRIDFIFGSEALYPQNAWISHAGNDWVGTDGVSDHPGVVAEYALP